MEMLISPLSAENRVIRDFWGIKIARDIRVIFMRIFLRACIESPWCDFTPTLEPVLAQSRKSNPIHLVCHAVFDG
jgi:hypothetical protein